MCLALKIFRCSNAVWFCGQCVFLNVYVLSRSNPFGWSVKFRLRIRSTSEQMNEEKSRGEKSEATGARMFVGIGEKKITRSRMHDLRSGKPTMSEKFERSVWIERTADIHSCYAVQLLIILKIISLNAKIQIYHKKKMLKKNQS